MGWSYLQSVYFFAITVSTIGFGACGVREKDEQIYLLFYMWLCVVLFGVGLALIIQAAHGSAENLLATKSAGAQDDDGDDVRLLGARPRPRASRALRTARWRIQVLSYKLVLILAEGLLIFLLATWFMAWCEGWSLLTSAIYATEALTSIGFGDSLPATRAGKVFTIFYALFGTFVFARFLAFAVWYPKHWRDSVWKSTSGMDASSKTSNLSISVKSKSIRLIFGRIDCSRRVLEARPKSSRRNCRIRAH